MTKKRILFVDDDARILNALDDLLYRDRKRWDMVFANSGEEGLAALRAKSFDVVVSDMRMPGMDGATLLGIVMTECPGAARIVLSGQAEREAIVRALPYTHQFLSKPCEASVLRRAIERCLEVVGRPRADVRAMISRLDRLPSPSRVFAELTTLAEDSSSSLVDVERVVATDSGLAAKILQLANSAAFGVSRRISSIRDAVAYLGIELIRCLALTSSILASATSSPIAGFSVDAANASALRVATLARRFAQPANADLVFAAGILHDIGELVLAMGLPGYVELQRDARVAKEPLVTAEYRELGLTHAEVGACLLGMWGLPELLALTVAHHHEVRTAPAAAHEVVAPLHVADALVGPDQLPMDREFLASIGFGDQVARWCALAEQP